MPDEIWDEDRWEVYLREHDRQFDRFMTDVHAFMRLHPPPSEQDCPAYRQWKDELMAFLLGKGWRHLGFFSPDLDAEPGDDTFSEDDAHEDETEAARPAVYAAAFRLGTLVMQWSNELPGYLKDSTLVHFCAGIMEVGAGVARGHALGYEQDTIGGNIAWVKRSLNAANAALESLQEMKHAPYMGWETYVSLYEQTYEVRNGLALYVQDLRERFRLGVD